MDFRDDINYLLAINNWFLMVASVPQLNFNVGAHENDTICTEELNILVSILKQRTTKFPGASAIIETIERLRAQGSGPRMGHTQGAATSGDDGIMRQTPKYLPIPGVEDLFTFPKSMCPRMDLLDASNGYQDIPDAFEDGTNSIFSMDDWAYDLGNFTFLASPF